MKQENTNASIEAVNEDRRKALGKLKYAPPVIATLMVSDSAWAQVSGGNDSPPPPPPSFP